MPPPPPVASGPFGEPDAFNPYSRAVAAAPPLEPDDARRFSLLLGRLLDVCEARPTEHILSHNDDGLRLLGDARRRLYAPMASLQADERASAALLVRVTGYWTALLQRCPDAGNDLTPDEWWVVWDLFGMVEGDDSAARRMLRQTRHEKRTAPAAAARTTRRNA